MKFTVLKAIFFSSLISFYAQAQDTFETSIGEVKVNPVLHGTLVIEFDNRTIYVDPYGGAERFEGFQKPDLVLITDIHGDHLNQSTLDALDLSGAILIVPQAVQNKISDPFKDQCEVIGNGESTVALNIDIAAIPMYNLPDDETSRHKKGRGNGYILTFGDTKFYISGDTEDIDEMRALTGIDVAFVCMNLPYTMSVDQAADAVNEFKPTIVYPYHYRGQGGLSDVEKFAALVTDDVEVRLRNWYPQ